MGGGEAVELGESPEGFYCPGEKKAAEGEEEKKPAAKKTTKKAAEGEEEKKPAKKTAKKAAEKAE